MGRVGEKAAILSKGALVLEWRMNVWNVVRSVRGHCMRRSN